MYVKAVSVKCMMQGLKELLLFVVVAGVFVKAACVICKV